mmetsp:Transcript_9257/g.34543  ORF Transcript_9257/g.34543 Transcript_9257/m.34543 type:complete len:326 (-) Transcript_9257:135-1112(-)
MASCASHASVLAVASSLRNPSTEVSALAAALPLSWSAAATPAASCSSTSATFWSASATAFVPASSFSVSFSTSCLVSEALNSASSQASVPAVCTALGGTDASVTGKLIREVETGESILGIETARAGGELGEGGGRGGDSGDGGGGGGEGGGWHACACASKGIAAHVSVLTNVSKRLCSDTWQRLFAWQEDRPHNPLSAPESNLSNLVKSTSYARDISACTAPKVSNDAMVCASAVSFLVTSALYSFTPSLYLANTMANLLCAFTRASKVKSSRSFLCLHVSAKHMSWGVSTSRERARPSMASIVGSQSWFHQTSLRPMWWCLLGS